MTLATIPPPPTPPAHFTPQQYFYLSEQNMLGDGRTELINGEIIRMCSQYDDHAFGVSKAASWLNKAFPEKRFWVRVQMTLHCNDNVPEPDLAVIEGPAKASRTYMTGDRAVLVIEIADSTVLADTRVKPAVYAAVGVPEYWVLDIPGRRLIVHRRPVKSRGRWTYAAVSSHESGFSITSLANAKRKLRVGDLLP